MIDRSKLFIRETVLDETNRKYAYHWQDRNGKLLDRWDNAPDWEISTFPHHKHMGEEDRVEPSYERTLEQVMPDGFVKSPSVALRFTFVAAAYLISTPHSSGFARLASEAFYAAIAWATFCEIIMPSIAERLEESLN